MTPRSDIFSLGAVLYELATGSVAFDGESEFDVQEKIVRGGQIPADRRVEGIDPVLAAVIARAIETDPSARFATCNEFARALEATAVAPRISLRRSTEETRREFGILPMLVLNNEILFPGAELSVSIVSSAGSLLMKSLSGVGARLLVATNPGKLSSDASELRGRCVEAEVVCLDGSPRVVLRGIERRHVTAVEQEQPFLVAAYEGVVEVRRAPAELDRLRIAIHDTVKALHRRSPDTADQTAALDSVKDPARLGDAVAAFVNLPLEERLAALGELDVDVRLRRLSDVLTKTTAEKNSDRELMKTLPLVIGVLAVLWLVVMGFRR